MLAHKSAVDNVNDFCVRGLPCPIIALCSTQRNCESRRTYFNFRLSVLAELTRIKCPLSITGSNQIADHSAYVFLLRRVVVRSSMVARDRHCPRLVALVQIAQKFGCVFNVALRFEHGRGGAEVLTMEVMVDLHASNVDQLATLPLCRVELSKRLLLRRRKVCLSLYIHSVRVKAPLTASFSQSYRVEDALRHTIFGCRRLDFLLAYARRCGCFRDRVAQSERRQRYQDRQWSRHPLMHHCHRSCCLSCRKTADPRDCG